MIPLIEFKSVVLDTRNVAELAQFYKSLLGGEIVYEIENFVAISVPGGTVSISCQLDEDYVPPVWPSSREEQMQMVHLDFSVRDMDAAVQYALSLGATKPLTQYWQPELGAQWVTLLDPAGHPFCLCAYE